MKNINPVYGTYNGFKLNTSYNNRIDYIFEKNEIFNDPRVTTVGKFFRKFWLDELPMFINIFKGFF